MTYIAVENGKEYNSDYYIGGASLAELIAKVETIINARSSKNVKQENFTIYRVSNSDIYDAIIKCELKECATTLIEWDSEDKCWY